MPSVTRGEGRAGPAQAGINSAGNKLWEAEASMCCAGLSSGSRMNMEGNQAFLELPGRQETLHQEVS